MNGNTIDFLEVSLKNIILDIFEVILEHKIRQTSHKILVELLGLIYKACVHTDLILKHVHA